MAEHGAVKEGTGERFEVSRCMCKREYNPCN